LDTSSLRCPHSIRFLLPCGVDFNLLYCFENPLDVIH
jgi:hypothetical protein